MGIKIKNLQTGEFEKFNIPALKGEKGEPGEIEPSEKVDYIGKQHSKLRDTMNANVDYAVKTAIGEFNYLDYDGQHITATDSIEGRSKSAILKGQTLVNLWDNIGQYSIAPNDFVRQVGDCFKKSTKYLLKYNVLQTNTNNSMIVQYYQNSTWVVNELSYAKLNEDYYILTTPSADFNDIRIFYANSFGTETVILKDIMLIEYQEGMENWDIPYFEGMQSVKMPVLTSTGKNLADINNSTTNNIDKIYIPCYLVKGNNYTITTNVDCSGRLIAIQTINDEEVQIISNWGVNNKQFTFNGETGKYLLLIWRGSLISEYPNIQVQLEQGLTETSYEPYKTNILTAKEDVELRGIGDVRDTLDCLTGEVVERIGEVVLDGSNYDFSINNNTDTIYLVFNTQSLGIKKAGLCVCDKLPYKIGSEDMEHMRINADGNIVLWFNKSKFQEINKSFIQTYLFQNPVRVQYELAEKSIKTVDLSDNHVYSYKGTTHYDCSSAESSLVPTLSVKVPTDVQATIAQQRETIKTLNSENERLNQIQEALKASMLDSQVQLMNLTWDTDFEVFTLRESIAPKDFLLASRTGSNIDKFSQAKFIIENDCPDLEKLNSQIEYYFSKDVFSQEQFEELTDLISIVKGGNGCEY